MALQTLKRILFFSVFVSLLLLLPLAFKKATDGFRLAKIQLDYPYVPEWDAEGEAGQILNQPFFYLGKGAQSYVFESKDGKHVIKVFRYDQMKNPVRMLFRSHFGKKKRKSTADAKIRRVFNACKIAYEEAREETGLELIHLNITEGKFPIIRVRDALGRPYKIALDRIRFAVQKKAEPFRKTLRASLKSGDRDRIKSEIDSFFSLLEARIAKGIYNSDPTVSRNFGFVDGKAVEFDFGNYFHGPITKEAREKQICKFAARLKRWLERNSPEWADYVEAKISAGSEELSR